MPFEPRDECPICRQTLELDRQLEDHLLRTHTKREVVRFIASRREWTTVENHPVKCDRRSQYRPDER